MSSTLSNYVNICSLVNKCISPLSLNSDTCTDIYIILYTRLIITIIVARLSKKNVEIRFDELHPINTKIWDS